QTQTSGESECFGNSKIRVNDIVLRDVPKQRAKLAEVFVQVSLIKSHFSGLGGSQNAQSIEQRGFTSAARSKNPYELARFGYKACTVQDGTVVALPGEPDGNDPSNRKPPDTNQPSSVVDKEERSK